MRRAEGYGTYTDDDINRLAMKGKARGTNSMCCRRVLPARPQHWAQVRLASESTLNSLHKKVDFMMSLFKSDSKYSDMFSQFESGGANGSGGCGDDEESADAQKDEDEDGDGDRIVAGERIPSERSPANFLQRLVAGEKYPQRQVDGESPEFSPGKGQML
ncbi:hypothetical protein Tco_0195090 [Tanacetum coccineum]